MDPEHWRRIEELYNSAMERMPAERAALLEQCQDEEVRREVQSLLDHERITDLRTLELG